MNRAIYFLNQFNENSSMSAVEGVGSDDRRHVSPFKRQ